MSYLNFPQLHFFGTFRADPSTLNNTPDNFNPNNNFPPYNGQEVSNNIQLYWNPDGTAQFLLNCKVSQIRYVDGSTATTPQQDPLIQLPLASIEGSAHESASLDSARVVDLDPMQQNVTEIWGLRVAVGSSSQPSIQGAFKPSAYSNAWVQVKDGRGDYAGSANYQSVLEAVKLSNAIGSRFIDELIQQGGDPDKLSIDFVLRSFNSASQQYLVNGSTLPAMQQAGVSAEAIAAITPLSELAQGRYEPKNPNAGLIPTTSYFQKLLSERLAGLNVPQEQVQTIIQIAQQPPSKPLTEYDFTYGQVFGTIGLAELPTSAVPPAGPSFGPAPDFLTPDRMLAPLSIVRTKPPLSAPTDSGSYAAYFAPVKVTQYEAGASGVQTYVSVNLGNSLVSTQPAGPSNAFVDASLYHTLALYCFGETNKVLAHIDYADFGFYDGNAAIANVLVDEEDVDAIQTQPLGLVSLDAEGNVSKELLRENEQGFYVRPNQFVYRMNPGMSKGLNPGSTVVQFYVSRFGQPASGIKLTVKLMPPLDAQTYSNNTLGTGGTSGMVNMSVPESAVHLENNGIVATDENGIASLRIKASDPGNPRGYLDGQIYFLQYGFQDPSLQDSYVQSPDDLVSLQIYDEQPNTEDITWENFVGPILMQYHKIYPVMSFIDLGSEKVVKEKATEILTALKRNPDNGGDMPVTRDLSAGRLKLIVQWLGKYAN